MGIAPGEREGGWDAGDGVPSPGPLDFLLWRWGSRPSGRCRRGWCTEPRDVAEGKRWGERGAGDGVPTRGPFPFPLRWLGGRRCSGLAWCKEPMGAEAGEREGGWAAAGGLPVFPSAS